MKKKITLLIFVILGFCYICTYGTVDVGAIHLITPVSPMYSATNQTVTVTVKNFSTDTLNFSSDNTTIIVNVTGASTQFFTIMVSNGQLFPGDTLNVNVTTLCNLNVAGTHIFDASATVAGDSNTGNDVLPSSVNILVMTVDVGVTAITSPALTLCPANNQSISVTLKNYDASQIDFTVKPVTITVTITGASTQSFTTILTTGSLASGATQSINVTAICDLTAIGIHTFNISATVSGDVNTSNDALNPATDIAVNGITGGIITSPQTICNGGDPAAFTDSIAATGSGTLSYKWKSSADGYTAVLGTSNIYDIPAGLTSTNTYRRITTSTLNGIACTSNSNDLVVTVNSVTGGSIGNAQTICNGGDPIAFTEASASTGDGMLSYEWKSSADGYSAVLGMGTTYDVAAGLTATTTYRRITKNTLNGITCTAASNDIVITVQGIVTGGTITSDQNVCSGGDPVAFAESSASSGTGTITYQWKSSADGYTATLGTGITYDAPSGITASATYRRITTSTLGSVGCTATSNDVVVTVNAVTGGTIASAQTICSGGDPATFTEITPATGTGALTYEWKSNADGYSSVLATAATYDVPTGLTATTIYRRIAKSTVGSVSCTANSNDVVITVNNVTAGTITSAQTICNGGDPVAFTESSASTGSGVLTYAWKSSADGYTATISTSSLYNPPVLTTTTTYNRSTISTLNGLSCASTSNDVVITVQAVVTGGTIASAQTICSGGNPAAFTVSTAATGSGSLTYEWRSSANGYTSVLGSSATYDAPAGLTSATTFRRTVISTVGSVGCTANSNDVVVSINNVTGGAITSAQTICSGGDPAAFSESTASTGSGTLTYTWKRSTDSYSATLGTSPLTYDPPALTATTTYRRITTSTLSGVACPANSNDIVITVNLVTPGTIASNQTICYGGDPAVFSSSPAATGTGTLTYEWESSADSYTATIATIANYNVPIGLTATTNYRRMVTSTTGGSTCSATSNDVTVTVNPPVTGGTIASPQTICSGGDPAVFMETAPSSGSGTITYQWKRSTDNYTATLGTDQTYDPPALTATTTYRRVTVSTNGATCTANSNDVVISINTVTGGTVSTSQTICYGGNPAPFTQTASATGAGTLTYEWASSDDGYSAVLSTNPTYDVPAGLINTTTYRRTVTSTLNGIACSINSNDVTVTVQVAVTGGVIASAQTICSGGDPATFTQSLAPSGGVGTYTYQWKNSTDGYSATIGSGSTYDPPGGITATATYRRIAISTLGSVQCTATSNDVVVTVNNITGGTLASSQSICSGADPQAFTEIVPATTDGGTLSFAWKSSADGYTSVLSSSTTYDPPPGLTTTTGYMRIASSVFPLTTCIANSNTLTIYVDVPIGNNTVSAPQTICNGTAADTLTGTTPSGGNGIYTYLWESSTTSGTSAFSSATGTNINDSYAPGILTATTWYRRKVTSCSGNIVGTSAAIQISVNQTPVATATNSSQTICSGSAFQTMVLGTSNSISSTTFLWSRNKTTEVTGVDSSNTGNIGGAVLTNTTPNPVTVIFTIVPKGPAPSFCPGTPITASIVVNPKPTLSSSLTGSICSNDTFRYTPTSLTTGTIFFWERAAVTGISEAPASDTTSINEMLTSYASFPLYVTYKYTLTANNCQNIQNVLVTVNPVPTLSSDISLINICSGASFNYTPSSSAPGAIYTWARNAVPGLSNALNNGGGSPNEVLIDTTNASVTTAYIYHVSANGCTNPFNYTLPVRVSPHPALISSLTPSGVCSGTPFTYTPGSSTTGVSYTWTRSIITGISDAARSSTGNINETLINTTNDSVSVPYTYNLSVNGCNSDSSYNVVTMIYPAPTLTGSLSDTLCSGGLFRYIPISSLTGTVFHWTRAIVNGISNPASNGTDTISETLVNRTTSPVTVNYVYSLAANGCSNTNPNNVAVTVLPPPVLTSNTTPASICSSTSLNYVPSGTPLGISYTWTRDTIAGISNNAGNGTDTINETLVNTTAFPLNVTYIYRLSANGCSDSSNYSVVVKINPSPSLSSSITPPAVCSGSTFYYLPTSLTTGTTFSWSRAAVQGLSNPATIGINDPVEVLRDTTTNPINVTYLYTLTANSCTDTQSVTVAVNPIPQLSSTVTPSAICSGDTFSYTPSSLVPGATFTWVRNAVAGISNSLATGADNPNEALINTSAATVNVDYVYTTSLSGCNSTKTVTVAVKPRPELSSYLFDTLCSGNVFNYIPGSNLLGSVIYSWSRPLTNGISNPAANGTGTINETLINTASDTVSVPYTLNLSANNGCTSPTNYTVKVLVNPNPVLTSNLSPPAICSGNTFSYVPASALSSVDYTWNRNAVSGIAQPAANGINSINETLSNEANFPITVTYNYSVTQTGSGCHNSQNVVVTVNPIPAFTNTSAPAAICSGTVFSYHPSGTANNITYTWSRAAVSGISNTTATGTDSIHEVLTDTALSPVNVTYVYSLSVNGCTNPSSSSIVVTVNPRPAVINVVTTAATCSNQAFTYTPEFTLPGSIFTWSRAAVTGISNPTAIGFNGINETLINTTSSPLVVTYSYSVSANGCLGSINNTAVTVNSQATGGILSGNTGAVCNGNNNGTLTLSGYTGTIAGWEYSSNNGTSWAGINNNSSSQTFTNLTATTIYRAVVQMGTCPVVYSENDTVTVNSAIAAGTILGSETVCNGLNSGTLTLSGYNGSILNWISSDNTGNTWISLPGGNSTISYSNITSTTYYATIIQSGSCTDTSMVAIVTVKPKPILSFTADTVCIGSTTTLTPTSAIIEGVIQNYIWDFGDFTSYTSGVMSSTVSHKYSNGGTYPVSFTAVSEHGCSSTVTNNIVAMAVPTVSITSGISSGTFGGMSLNATGGVSYSWTPAEGLSNTAVPNPNASPLSTTTYTVTVTDTNGCKATDTVTVMVNAEDAFLIPNLVTPNGDGHNDTWGLKLPGNYSSLEVTIMNVEGSTVFHSTNYHNEWDGTNSANGKLLPDGTYYYFIQLQGSEVHYKGTVAILSNH